MDYKCSYHSWVNFEALDEEMKSLLNKMQEDEENTEDAFYKNLEFGTGGMRGEIGAGTNRMNLYTVRKATVGIGSIYLNRLGKKQKEEGL